MPDNTIVSKEHLIGLLEHLAVGRKLVCPVDTGKVVEYRG